MILLDLDYFLSQLIIFEANVICFFSYQVLYYKAYHFTQKERQQIILHLNVITYLTKGFGYVNCTVTP